MNLQQETVVKRQQEMCTPTELVTLPAAAILGLMQCGCATADSRVTSAVTDSHHSLVQEVLEVAPGFAVVKPSGHCWQLA